MSASQSRKISNLTKEKQSQTMIFQMGTRKLEGLHDLGHIETFYLEI